MGKLVLAIVLFSTASWSQANTVVRWNQIVLTLLRTPGVQPATVHPARNLAILHAAIYDAVKTGTNSPEAAADAAAHTILLALYPVPFIFGTGPVAYQLTPPNFPAPVFTGWSQVTPFVLTSASQFRPGPPPELTSETYANDFNEVKALGIEVKALGIPHSSAASIDQQLAGWFWNGAIQNYWNEIAETAAIAQGLTTAQTARLFALLNVSLADTVIVRYDAKYAYKFWRPVTAIRGAGNGDWLPETKNTAADPSYPGAHAALSSAAATVLASFFGSDQFSFHVTSEVFAGVDRSFSAFSAAAQEASLSRIYAGQHFRFDLTAGQQLGTSVSEFVLDNLLP